MRIALVSFEYPPFHGGGIGTYAGIMSRHLARAGNEVHVVANGWGGEYGGDDPAAGIEGLTVHRLHALDRSYQPVAPRDQADDPMGAICRRVEKSLYWSVLVADELERLHREVGLDVVEFPECFAEGFTALRRRAAGLDFADLAMCVHLHTPIRDHTELNLGRTWEPWFRRRVEMEELCIRVADRLSSPSRSLAGIVADRLRLDPGRHPCDVIPYAMDFDEARPENGVGPADTPSLLFVGRLEPRKGVVELVDAAVRVMREHPTVTVHLLGRDCAAGAVPGSMAEHLRRRIPAELTARFVFEGLRPRAEVLARYRAATACVFAAPWDNYPFTCCEAMASGAAVVVSDAGGMAELVEHERSGLVFPTGEVEALAAAIRRLLGQPELGRRLRRAAVERVRAVCEPRAVAEQRLDHYRRAIATVRGRDRSRQAGAA
jgi:glycosyltransferase involved in cell wall biosynthesis